MNITMKQVEGGVCAAAGFSANGLNCGLNPDRNKNDLALIWSEKECTAAAVYTTNKGCTNPCDKETSGSNRK